MAGHRAPCRQVRHSIQDAPTYPVDPENLANRVGIVAAEQGWCPEYTKATYQAWFLENRPPGAEDQLSQVLADLGRDPDEIIARANTDEIRNKYEAETDVARGLGIFGSPTFVVGSEIFWGDDRLEDALEYCLQRR